MQAGYAWEARHTAGCCAGQQIQLLVEVAGHSAEVAGRLVAAAEARCVEVAILFQAAAAAHWAEVASLLREAEAACQEAGAGRLVAGAARRVVDGLAAEAGWKAAAAGLLQAVGADCRVAVASQLEVGAGEMVEVGCSTAPDQTASVDGCRCRRCCQEGRGLATRPPSAQWASPYTKGAGTRVVRSL